jgi:hypothetical protein
MITLAGLERDVLIVACALSAGIHAALAPDHFAEGSGPGLGFAVAAVLLAAVVVALTRRPASAGIVAGASAVLAGLLTSYAFATTTGLPLLHPHPEPLDGLALATNAIEAAGLLAAAHLLWRSRSFVSVLHLQPKGS